MILPERQINLQKLILAIFSGGCFVLTVGWLKTAFWGEPPTKTWQVRTISSIDVPTPAPMENGTVLLNDGKTANHQIYPNIKRMTLKMKGHTYMVDLETGEVFAVGQ